MTSRLASAAVALVLAALPASAQTVGGAVLADLDGDGAAERFALIDDGDGSANLRIETPGAVIVARDIAWIGGIGQRLELSLAPNGSLRLTSMNEAIGRDRWHLTLTIAHRRGAYLVAGLTFDWYDTLDPDGYGTCDLNLLTGRGFLEEGAKPRRAVRTGQPALPVTEWTDAIPIPAACDRPR